MRKSALFALAFAAGLVVGQAQAEEKRHWTAPGYYYIEKTKDGPIIWQGPFKDEESCARLDAEDGDPNFYCAYLAAKPAWDK
jgi:hypothetical protein